MEKMLDNNYDIGLVCMVNLNIGNNLTNYALYQYLRDCNYSVLLIGNPIDTPQTSENSIERRFRLFLDLPYGQDDIWIPQRSKWELSDANRICDSFVLGSDQLWRDIFVKETDYFTCLDWAASEAHKIAYATSFGIDRFEGGRDMQAKMSYLLKRFHNISVREDSGVTLLKNLYGITAQHVLDPVFLCEKKHYRTMAGKGKARLPKEPYIGAYLLDITEEKENAVMCLADHMTEGAYEAITQPGEPVGPDVTLQLLSDPAVEEWLAMAENCDFYITDSFHGLCFALIFEKPFCVIFDCENWRGMSRIQSLLDLLQLQSHLIDHYDEETLLALYQEPVDYSRVNAILLKERKKSADWLNNALKERTAHPAENYGVHDFVWELNAGLQQKVQVLSEKLFLMQEAHRKTRNELFILRHTCQEGNQEGKRLMAADTELVGWGAGECFRRNIGFIKRFYNMEYVCDSDPVKWGQELEEHTLCISPKQLSGMENIMVIIMVDRAAVGIEIIERLREMGISRFEHVENWIAFIEGN